MAVKKLLGWMIIFVMTMTALSMEMDADNGGALSYGRIAVQMPEITAEIKGTGFASTQISAALGSEVLRVDRAEAYNAADDSVCAYILVDLSKSMRRSFELVKTNILHYVNLMGNQDRIVLITFGESEVTTLLDGSETKEEIIQAVNGLQCTENGTMFYEVLARAYQLSNAAVSSFDREYAIVFSDGMDEQMGNSTYEEIANVYKTHALPLYAACSSGTSKEAADRFGELTRMSGGSFQFVENEQNFAALLTDINNITIIRLLAAGNIADGSQRQLSIKIGDLQVEQSVPVARSIEDNIPPTVNEIRYDKKGQSIFITFSEAVDHALDSSSYSVRDRNGVTADVTSVVAVAANQVELKLKGLHNGQYTIAFHGIADCSKEANLVEGTQTVAVSGIRKAEEDQKETSRVSLWSIILIVVIALVLFALACVLLLRRRKEEKQSRDGETAASGNQPKPAAAPVISQQVDMIENEPVLQKQVRYHIKNNDSIAIELSVKTGKQAWQQVHMEVVSSVIVGRAAACDICIDDTKLSRQHFAIEYEQGFLFLTDLQSKNGTMLNGIRIGSRQKLTSGDKIFAGLSDMVIRF